MPVTEAHEDLRPLAFSIAYRMVGSVAEAEDLVQEALLRTIRAEEQGQAIESPQAFVSAVVTRLSIDHLRSARVRRESYIGPWLPEPLLTDPEPGPDQRAETSDSLSQAFLVLLEQLSPVERAVFLLREVFGYDYDQIARVVDRSPDNCRQLLVRAKRHVEDGRPRFDADRAKRAELAESFLRAAADGDTDALVSMLAADAAAYGDGGGKVVAARRPIHGAAKVAKFIAGVVDLGQRRGGYGIRPAWVNHQPGFVISTPGGGVDAVWALDVADGVVQSVRIVRNPDKLGHLS
ncbi:MAG TPA: RNA polymerase sigma-70 factor [Thermoleophilaceae bacterium]|nr:RNA polymerase sigma-70 factor [Thermoleophilaceae bacterium]